MRNSLRMRPDRIVVGEIRDAAALDMLQAMNTGHDGSICTVHANTPRDVLSRVETMVLMAGIDLPVRAIREQVSSAIDLIVHQARFKDGTRHITHVTEVVGHGGRRHHPAGPVPLRPQRRLRRRPATPSARLKSTGLRPKFLEKLAAAGVTVDPTVVRVREVRAMTRRRLAAARRWPRVARRPAAPPRPRRLTRAGRIVEVKRDGDALRMVFQADGLADGVAIDPDSVQVGWPSVDGRRLGRAA